MNSIELCKRAGITYRQLDYWVGKGWLGDDRTVKGSGSYRNWSNTDIEHATLMGRLVKHGLPPGMAHRIVSASPETAVKVADLLDGAKP